MRLYDVRFADGTVGRYNAKNPFAAMRRGNNFCGFDCGGAVTVTESRDQRAGENPFGE